MIGLAPAARFVLGRLAGTVRLRVSREKDNEIALGRCRGWDDTKAVQPDGCGQARRGWKGLVALQPDLLVCSTPTTTALLQQTRHTIPIVFAMAVDPVGSGFVASFAQPGDNVTGFIFTTEPAMAGKWVELLKEIAPRVARIAMPFNLATATYADYWLDPFK